MLICKFSTPYNAFNIFYTIFIKVFVVIIFFMFQFYRTMFNVIMSDKFDNSLAHK